MEIFCIIYYVCSYVQIIPQIVKLIRTKSSNDYSMGWLVIQLIGTIGWSLYIFTSAQSVVVYIGTVLDLLLLLVVDFFIVKYFNFKCKDSINV